MSSILLFLLALLPLVAVAVGMLVYNQPGARMAVMGWALTVIFAVLFFDTSRHAALGATLIGLIKSLGITLAVAATMYQVFLMKETGALTTISAAIKRLAATKEEQALFVGLAFGSFLTSLGVVTPALLPPLLVAMGFTPFAAIAVAVLGYNATTSFALLSIPLTLPAEAFGFSAADFAWKVALFLPVVSIGFAFGVLWLVGGRESIRRGWLPALLAGGTIAATVLVTTHPSTAGYVPLRLVGVVAGLMAMVVLIAYQKLRQRPASGKAAQTKAPPLEWEPLLRALSPWIILVVLAAIISIPMVDEGLKDLPGDAEVIEVFADPDGDGPISGTTDDLNFFSQIYTWIFIATLVAIPIMRPTREQLRSAGTVWKQRITSPMVAYSFFFAIAMVMYHSAKHVEQGGLVKVSDFDDLNIDVLLGSMMVDALGDGYLFAAAFLGLFGGFAGGSETGSNVLFYQVQKTAADGLELSSGEFMTLYASHAVAGGIASGITPAKITNGAAVLGESGEIEAAVLRKHLAICLLLTVATGLITVGLVMFS